jgi:hypothetical protein
MRLPLIYPNGRERSDILPLDRMFCLGLLRAAITHGYLDRLEKVRRVLRFGRIHASGRLNLAERDGYLASYKLLPRFPRLVQLARAANSRNLIAPGKFRRGVQMLGEELAGLASAGGTALVTRDGD